LDDEPDTKQPVESPAQPLDLGVARVGSTSMFALSVPLYILGKDIADRLPHTWQILEVSPFFKLLSKPRVGGLPVVMVALEGWTVSTLNTTI